MATLSTKQTLALFRCLDVPYAVGYRTVDPMGTLAAQHTVSNASQSAAKQAIETYVAGLTGAVGDELKTALDQYDLIKFDVTSLDNGAVSDISNVTYTAEDKREAIAKYVRVIVPFFKHHEVIARQQGNNSTVTLMR